MVAPAIVMHNSYYITKANFLRLFKALKRTYTVSNETVYKYPIPELSPERQQELLLIKCFLKEPAQLASVLPKVQKKDGFEQLFAPSSPAYHFEHGCERMHSHYFNLRLPLGISGSEERVTRCRQMFKVILLQVQKVDMPAASYAEQLLESVERLVQEIKLAPYFQRAFQLSGISLHNLNRDQFLPVERQNSSYSTLEIESEIDTVYNAFKQEVKRLRVEMQAATIFKKSYEEPITQLLVDFIIYTHNQALVFEEDVLRSLGFISCYSCCGYDDKETDNDYERPEDPIDVYRKYVERTYDVVHRAGKEKMGNTIHDPLLTPDNIKAATPGAYFCLHALYGFLQITFKGNNGGWYYLKAPRDEQGEPIEFMWAELWLVKYKDLSAAITSTKREALIIPVHGK